MSQMAMVAPGGRASEEPLSGGMPISGGCDEGMRRRLFKKESVGCEDLPEKLEGTIRVLSWNIRGFLSGQNTFHMDKITALRHHSLSSGADVICWNELNVSWPLVPPQLRLKQATRHWWEASHASLSYNRRDSSGKKDLHGGCAVLSNNKLCHRVIASGEDTTNLGRWAWTTFQGKRNMRLTVVSAYRPCSPSPNSANAVWHQHNSYFATINRAFESPREAILNDLFSLLARFHAQGHLLIVSIDLNEEVTSPQIAARFESLSMQLTHDFPEGFNTHSDGSYPIDGVWASSILEVVMC